MMVVWGSRLFGKADIVPGLFHVATRFGHVDYFPLIPLGSYVVLSQAGDEFQGVRISLSLKSLLLAWARAFGAVATALTAFFLFVVLVSKRAEPGAWTGPATALAVLLPVTLFLYRSKTLSHASYDRARQLGELIGLTEGGWAMIENHYGFGAPPHHPV